MRRAAFILLACAGACGGGGGGETCTGVGDAGVAGATITAGGETFVYGNFDWGFNNDCGMRSITIQGGQVTPPAQGFGIGLCVPVVERIGSGPATLADRNVVELVGASASNGDCSFLPSAGAMPSGTVTFGGFCTEPGASFTVTFAGQISGTRSCTSGGAPQPVTIQLGGTALVSPRP